MRMILAGLAALVVAACAHDSGKPQTVREMHQIHDWQHDRGARLYAALANDVSRIARKAGRAGTLAQLQAEGYGCFYGEAHEDYPEPAAVCSRSFASCARFSWWSPVSSVRMRFKSCTVPAVASVLVGLGARTLALDPSATRAASDRLARLPR